MSLFVGCIALVNAHVAQYYELVLLTSIPALPFIQLYLVVKNNIITGLYHSISDFNEDVNNRALPVGYDHHKNDNKFDYNCGKEKLYGITSNGILGSHAPGLYGVLKEVPASGSIPAHLMLDVIPATSSTPPVVIESVPFIDAIAAPIYAPTSTKKPTYKPTHKTLRGVEA